VPGVEDGTSSHERLNQALMPATCFSQWVMVSSVIDSAISSMVTA
jgi:hypothetical protein